MNPLKRQITAPTREGIIETHTYREWSDINDVTEASIQKRMSVLNQQKREGVKRYSMSQIVGTVKLKSSLHRNTRKKYDNKTMIARFLSKSLVCGDASR